MVADCLGLDNCDNCNATLQKHTNTVFSENPNKVNLSPNMSRFSFINLWWRKTHAIYFQQRNCKLNRPVFIFQSDK